jgi:teichuronic acid biosynthesis glycosyltransferase TuaC
MRVLWTHNFSPASPNSLVFISDLADAVRARGLDLHIEYLGNLRSASGVISARRRIQGMSRHFDVVHAQYSSACAVATAAAPLPKIVSVRGNDWNLHSDSIGFHYFHTRLARAMTRWALPRFDCVLAVSNRMADELRRFARRIEAVPSPIDLARFRPGDRAQARAALGAPDCGRKWVLFNALRLDDPIKRYPLAKAVIEIANARHGNVVLRVANGLRHDQLPLELVACDAILCTSETEGWPNSVKEALACDVPFVTTDVSDLGDIARSEPSCRVCPADAETLATNLLEVLALPRPSNLRRHVGGMSLDATCTRLISIYRDAVSGSAAAA